MRLNSISGQKLNFGKIVYSKDNYTQKYLNSLTKEEKDVFESQMSALEEKSGKKEIEFYITPPTLNFSLKGKETQKIPLTGTDLTQDLNTKSVEDIAKALRLSKVNKSGQEQIEELRNLKNIKFSEDNKTQDALETFFSSKFEKEFLPSYEPVLKRNNPLDLGTIRDYFLNSLKMADLHIKDNKISVKGFVDEEFDEVYFLFEDKKGNKVPVRMTRLSLVELGFEDPIIRSSKDSSPAVLSKIVQSWENNEDRVKRNTIFRNNLIDVFDLCDVKRTGEYSYSKSDNMQLVKTTQPYYTDFQNIEVEDDYITRTYLNNSSCKLYDKLKWINDSLDGEKIKLEAVDENHLKIIDENGNFIVLEYNKEEADSNKNTSFFKRSKSNISQLDKMFAIENLRQLPALQNIKKHS